MKKCFVETFLAVLFLVYINGNAAARSKNRMPAQKIKLYYLPPSPPSRVVMMTAKALGLELDLVLTNIMEGAHMTPEYLKMNPQHTIPTMDDNGFILWERLQSRWYGHVLLKLYGYVANRCPNLKVSGKTACGRPKKRWIDMLRREDAEDPVLLFSRAIQAYLVNAYGRDDSLYPRSPRQRALVDQRLMFDVGTLFPRYLALYAPMLFQGKEYDEGNAAKLSETLGHLNIMLEGRTFVAGDNLSIADISILTTLTNLEALGFDYSAHENVSEWFERMKREMEPFGYKEIDHAGAQILASFLKKE